MDSGKFAENTSLKSMLGSFLDSYAERDKNTDFSYWLERRLRQEMPELSEAAGRKMAGEIIEAVSSYDKTLDELNAAIAEGQSKEEWLAERLAEAYEDMPSDIVGAKLQQIEGELAASNSLLMREMDNSQMEDIDTAEADTVEWNEYSIKNKVYGIGKQILLSGTAVAANVVKKRMQGGEISEAGSVVEEKLQNGMEADSEEVKAVVAGAMKAAAENGLTDIDDETIGDMAGVAVESAEALYDAACGKSTIPETLDRIGRAGIAAACRWCAGALKGVIKRIPVFGPKLVDACDSLLEHVKSPKFTEDVYTAVRGVASKILQGMKEIGGKVIHSLKNALFI